MLRGVPVVAPVDRQREAHLILNPKDKRVSGSGGCNQLIGAYTLAGDHIVFAQLAGTMMACLGSMDQEQTFLRALPSVTNWRVVGQRLGLSDGHGTVVARFEAVTAP